MSNNSYDTEIYSRGTTINDLFDNYLLFIHNVQIQQSNLFSLNNTMHNSLYNLINTTITNNEQRLHFNQRTTEQRQNRRQAFLNRGRSSFPLNINRTEPIQRNYTHLHPSVSSFLSSSPVRVYPTTEQINNSTSISLYSNISEQHNSICPIRNEEFSDNDIVIQINHCGHTFYPNEFYGWFRDHVHCPMCRYDIREDASHSVVDTSINNITGNTTRSNNNIFDNSLNTTEFNIPIDISSSFFIYDLSLSTPPSNNTVSEMSNRQLNSLTQLTQTMARELLSQLSNSTNSDLSSSEIELALSFTNNRTRVYDDHGDDHGDDHNIDSID